MEELKLYFETKYSEYKEYENFLKSAAEEIKAGKEELAKFVTENIDDKEKVAEKVYEIETQPQLYINDLTNLQRNLLEIYKTVSLVVDFPQEIKDEVSKFAQPKQIYTIKNGKAEDIDPEYTKRLKEDAKKYYIEAYSNLNFK